ncbi:hydrogenase-2 assembly chaperone [Brenneria rubrifaciens]|uniref:Hydrogenase-2 assembly chaperone n=1 Tax=Brenneria rubrifaciens TaxID=55213 RepID=A0A4P8QUG7_9GAMM|nr:hydrogenase-2 assembly chaperone [Brenneria rubrifaciens]QCR09130.1 hydrogenase-2 assembly chaperone [Brenneria rubrifaciens]
MNNASDVNNVRKIAGERKESLSTRRHDEHPAAWLEQRFTRIADEKMRSLPFFHEDIPVRACGFTLFEQQWVGCLLTPWMMSLLVLPGPGQVWPIRTPAGRQGLALPCGNVTFIVGEMSGRQYLSCSLMSPIDRHLRGEQAVLLAEQSVRMALSLPVADGHVPRNSRLRALFSGNRSGRHA